MTPKFYINNIDYASYIAEINPVRNDLDKDGSGRNILDGYFYRTRITSKEKWKIQFIDLDEDKMAEIASALYPEYLTIGLLNPRTKQYETKQYYTSSFDYGSQRLNSPADEKVMYFGASVEITER